MNIEMTLEDLAFESLWWLGAALLAVLAFVAYHLYMVRLRRGSKRNLSPEALKLWQQVQQKRKNADWEAKKKPGPNYQAELWSQ